MIKESTLEIVFPEHGHNNEESAAHFEANKAHFSKQSHKVLELLHDGKELTCYSAMLLGIGHLPSAIRHLQKRQFIDGEWREIQISSAWIREENKTKYKKWWITPEQKHKNLELINLIIKNQNNGNK